MEAGQDLWLADGQRRGEPQGEGRKVTGSASKGRKSLLLLSSMLAGDMKAPAFPSATDSWAGLACSQSLIISAVQL